MARATRTQTAAGTAIAAGHTPALERHGELEEPRVGLGLATAYFLRAAALVCATLLSAIAFSSWRANALAERKLREDLRSVPEVFEAWAESQALARRNSVRSRAEDAGVKALLAESEAGPETFHDSARDFAQALGAEKVFLIDAGATLIARSDRNPGQEGGHDFSQVGWVTQPLAELRETSAWILDLEPRLLLSMVAAAPVTQGEGAQRRPNGVLAAAWPVDGQAASALGRLVGGEAVFLADAGSGGPAGLRLAAGTQRVSAPDVATQIASIPGAYDTLFQRGVVFGPFELAIDGEALVATAVPLRTAGREPVGAFVAARSKAVELAAFRQLRNGLLAIGGVLLLVSLPISFLMARQVARPIEQLAAAALAIRQGRLDVSLPEAGGEVGVLARAFQAMLAEMREKAVLEEMLREPRPGRTSPPPAQPAHAAAPGVGEVFAERYQILSVVGRGGLGDVFLAWDQRLDDEVALKVLRPNVAADAGTMKLLAHALKLARRINHPNVMRTHDLAEAGGVFYLPMEHVPGRTLKDLTGHHGELELTPGLQIAKQLCRGLGAIHTAGIRHADPCPHNVVVMASGVVKLMDFGVRPSSASRSAAALSLDAAAYASPESFRDQVLDERSDLYSLGVMMFEMFLGRMPFAASGLAELREAHLSARPPEPKLVRASLPDQLARLIHACLAKAPAERPASAAELERALSRVPAALEVGGRA